MKPFLRFTFLFFAFLAFSGVVKAQNLTGIWRGYFITEFGEQYKFEIQIEQNKSNRITGVSYSYLDTRFYGKATLSGMANPSAKTALIQETKTVELKMSSGSVACIMKCKFEYAKSGKEEFLEGTYTSAYEKTNEAQGVIKGGNCGGGKVFLRKVTTSDFYVEPFLREKPVAKSNTPANKPSQPATRKPAENKPIAKAPERTPAKTPPPANKPVTPKPSQERKHASTPSRTNEVAMPKSESPTNNNIIKPKAFQLPAQTRARTNELTKTLTVTSEEILIKLYDNGVIDNDTISVYHNDKLILHNKMLTASPLIIKLTMDENNPEHVLVMVAENLGTIPPNTSLMIVQDGDKRYEVSITSTEQKNAMVRFRYQKPRE